MMEKHVKCKNYDINYFSMGEEKNVDDDMKKVIKETIE